MAPLWSVMGASFAAAIGLTVLLAATAAAPLARADVAHLDRPGWLVCALASVTALALAGAGKPLATLTVAGLALAAAGVAIAARRARPGDDGGGGHDVDPDPPDGPGGVAWDEFEAAFWAYVERERSPV